MSSPKSYCVFSAYKKVQPKINKVGPHKQGEDLNTVFNTGRSQFRIQFPKHQNNAITIVTEAVE